MPHSTRFPFALKGPERSQEEYKLIGQAAPIPQLPPGLSQDVAGLLLAILQALAQQGALFNANVDALYNLAAIQDPEAFALVVSPRVTPITPGAAGGTSVYQNLTTVHSACHVRMEMLENDTNVYFYLSPDDTNPTTARAVIGKQGAAPTAKVIVGPQQTLYARVTTQNGNSTARNVIVIPVPLRGRIVLEGIT